MNKKHIRILSLAFFGSLAMIWMQFGWKAGLAWWGLCFVIGMAHGIWAIKTGRWMKWMAENFKAEMGK